jgi:hypothetical protein
MTGTAKTSTTPNPPKSGVDWVDELNARYFVLKDYEGDCVVGEWTQSETVPGHKTLSTRSFTAFKNAHDNQHVDVGKNDDGSPKRRRRGTAWLTHGARRDYEGVRFDPNGAPVIAGCLNLWQGLAVEPTRGSWSRMRAHILDVIAAGNEAHADYITKWLAWKYQNPGLLPQVALGLLGSEGIGKGAFALPICESFGVHGRHFSKARYLVGPFNKHLRQCCFAFADEVLAPKDHEAAGVIKTLVTEPTLDIEGKHKDAGPPAANHLGLIVATNEAHAIMAGKDARRWALFDVSPARMGDRPYFAKLGAERRAAGSPPWSTTSLRWTSAAGIRAKGFAGPDGRAGLLQAPGHLAVGFELSTKVRASQLGRISSAGL